MVREKGRKRKMGGGRMVREKGRKRKMGNTKGIEGEEMRGKEGDAASDNIYGVTSRRKYFRKGPNTRRGWTRT